jgi:exosortase K
MKTAMKTRAFFAENTLFYGLGLLMAYALKHHYSRATGDGLDWILSPTASLVAAFTGIHFEKEAFTGFVSRESAIIIAPACAGVNFLISAFSLLVIAVTHNLMGAVRKLLGVGISAATAFILTVCVNALRIATSVFLYRADIYDGWTTPERIHRIDGTLIYFFSLLLIYPAACWIGKRLGSRKKDETMVPVRRKGSVTHILCAGAAPFFCYLALTVGVPILNQAWRSPKFVEHCFMVVGGSSLMLLLFFLVALGRRRIDR